MATTKIADSTMERMERIRVLGGRPGCGEVVVSRNQDWLREQFDTVEESKVDGQRVATVPHTVFQDHGLLTDADIVFFAADKEELVHDACRMVTEEDLLGAFPQEIVDKFKPD